VSVTITKKGFSAELAQVKAKTISGSGREAGLGRVTGLRCFPYPRVVGLAGLNSNKAKNSPRNGFSLIPKPVPG
jgi:hypothetical protein